MVGGIPSFCPPGETFLGSLGSVSKLTDDANSPMQP